MNNVGECCLIKRKVGEVKFSFMLKDFIILTVSLNRWDTEKEKTEMIVSTHYVKVDSITRISEIKIDGNYLVSFLSDGIFFNCNNANAMELLLEMKLANEDFGNEKNF